MTPDNITEKQYCQLLHSQGYVKQIIRRYFLRGVPYHGDVYVRREQKLGRKRIDFYAIDQTGFRYLIEVKVGYGYDLEQAAQSGIAQLLNYGLIHRKISNSKYALILLFNRPSKVAKSIISEYKLPIHFISAKYPSSINKIPFEVKAVAHVLNGARPPLDITEDYVGAENKYYELIRQFHTEGFVA